uniref:Bms1-type G domain-containing protein n=1 Tax=Rhabditophanes sp. KR3021 TaxID=114890 RepID=A0AC35TQY6_9BILA
MPAIGHRAGGFNLPKKKHNSGRHRTKGEINRAQAGKIDVVAGSRANKLLASKLQRRNQGKDARAAHRANILNDKRLKGIKSPIIVTIISLDNEVVKATEVINAITTHPDVEVQLNKAKTVMYAKVRRFQNAQFGFLTPQYKNIEGVFDSLKITDVLMIVWPTDGEIKPSQESFIRQIKSFGLPTIMNCAIPVGVGKEKSQVKGCVEKMIQDSCLGDGKFHYLDLGDIHNTLRLLKECKKKPLGIQLKRSYMVGDDMSKIEVVGEENDCIAVKCVIRGAPLNPNRPLHIQGIGNFQIGKVVEVENMWSNKPFDFSMTPAEGKREWLSEPNAIESLEESIMPDPLDAEQTWPSREDEALDANFENIEDETNKKVSVKVPVGTSDYQAAWYLNNDGEAEDSDEDASDEEGSEDEEFAPMEEEDDEDRRTINMADNASVMLDEEMMEEDEEAYDMYKDARLNAKFPDEIETPKDVASRTRFAKYRGLKSFRSSKWDARENLPYDYGRIFKISNFLQTKKLLNVQLKEEYENDKLCVPVGTTCVIFIKNMPVHMIEKFTQGRAFVIYQLMKYEQKMSVMNIVLKRVPGFEMVVKNKAKMIFQVGFRKFACEPIFSQHTNGDKFKMERFMPEEGPFVATVYAPITFPPCPVLAYVENEYGGRFLAATGSILDLNPDRVVLKRTVLSGHPFKINRRSVVCRYLFFDKEDIEYFKPLELWCPSGARGFIKESLGTHGLLKCTFDRQLNAMDVILLNLYKRVYPKWNYDPYVSDEVEVLL